MFSTFRVSLSALSHIQCFLRSWFILFSIIFCELSERVMLVSSAKWYELEHFRYEWKSLMWMNKNNGPRTYPDTRDTISLIVEAWLPMDTNCCLPFRYKQNQLFTSPIIPLWSNFVRKMPWSTASKALLRSTKTDS